MSEQEDDHVTTVMNQMLKDLSHTPSNPSIHRVSDHLRRTNQTAYDPTIIAIGPLHRHNQSLKKMEDQKKRYLQKLLNSREEPGVKRYVEAMKRLESEARKCYTEEVTLEKDEFVQMLILDGIFIVEFLRKFNRVHKKRQPADEDDHIFLYPHIQTHLLYDLMLFENQIPFFIVEELFNLSQDSADNPFSKLFWPFLESQVLSDQMLKESGAPHLLGLVHYVNCASFAKIVELKDFKRRQKVNKKSASELEMVKINSDTDSDAELEMVNINSAIELEESGIKFKPNCKREGEGEDATWLNVFFKRESICFPTLTITDATEPWLRNMVAYEHNFPMRKPRFVTDYTFFLQCLVHTAGDVQLLRRCGIISNWLGGDDMVCDMIKKLGTNVQTSEPFSYLDVFDRINSHCRRRRHQWMAMLRHDYFKSPWTLVSVVAGFVLLATGVVQMVFAILSYCEQKKVGS